MSYFDEMREKRVSEIIDPDDMAHFRRKAKSPENELAEKIERGYTRRSNVCDVCHTTRSRTGSCFCDE